MSRIANIRLFEKVSHVDSYLKFRPTYPSAVFEKILSFLNKKKSSPHDLQIDVACGSGQATFGLVSQFKRVIGFDVSDAQIEAASKANTTPNVEFKVSPGEKLPVEPCSADLVTCAQAAHWLDFPAFCKESDRVLRPGGCLAVFGYGIPCPDHPNPDIKKQLTKDFDELYNQALGSYWNERRRHVENKYADFSLPYEDSIRDDSVEMRMNWSVDHYMGYLKSWSAYQKFLEENPSQDSLLNDYRKKVLTALGDPKATPESTMLDVVLPIFMLLGRKAPSTPS